jgi:hypothetical protein
MTLRALERYTRPRGRSDAARCELCGDAIGDEHRHAVDIAERQLLCICSACTLLLSGNEHGRCRAVPEGVRFDATSNVTDADVARLGVPVSLAFFFRSSATGKRIAVLPSPAGPTEVDVDDESWALFASGNRLAGAIVDDVEALLLFRHEGRWTVLAVPVDVGYGMVGLVRSRWRGIDGGDEARRVLEDAVARLSLEALPIDGSATSEVIA